MYSIAPFKRQEEAQNRTAPPIPVWRRILYSPLWFCLLIGITVRLFLILHGDPSLAGDEAMTGIQAESILRGLHPIYYYNQPYMGSLEAYILALFFALAGPSVFMLRVATGSVSLILIVLTWCLSSALAEQAHLAKQPKALFVFVATLTAALPPLYGTILEMRSLGGYVEAMVIMLWILLAALRLSQRWRAQASHRELLLRWLGLGFLIGLGLWVNPLIVYGLATAVLWLGGSIIAGLLKPLPRPHARRTLLLEILLALGTIPGALIGFIPGIIYGLQNHWINLTYMLNNGSSQQSTLTKKWQLLSVYTHCTAPRVIGGSLPTEPYVGLGHPATLTPALVIGFICLVLVTAAIIISYVWQHPVVMRARQLALMPMIFMVITSIVFCTSSIVALETRIAGCSQTDLTGRYAGPLVLALPFILATVITLCWSWSKRQASQAVTATTPTTPTPPAPRTAQTPVAWASKIALVLVLAVYFLSQFYYYAASDPQTVFKNPNCIKMLSNETAIDQYMQQNNIHYAFATGWIADPITFTTNGSILVTEPPPKGRVLVNDLKVLHADNYGFLFFASATDSKPTWIKLLDQHHYHYTIKRFPSYPGWDIVVVMPAQKIALNDPVFHTVMRQTLYNQC
jgi:hypothetical protein